MKLSRLLQIATFVSVISCIGITFNIYKLNSYTDQAEMAHLKQLELYELGIEFAAASDYLTDEARAFSQFGDQKHYDNYWKEVNETKTRPQIIERLKTLNVSPNELSLLVEALDQSDALVQIEKASMQAAQQGDFTTARKLLFDENYTSNKKLIMSPIHQFQKEVNQNSNNLTRSVFDNMSKRTRRAYVVLVVFLIFIVCTFSFLYFQIRPLFAIAKKLLDFANSKGDLTQRLNVTSENEIGNLAQNFNAFTDTILALVKSMQQSGKQVHTFVEEINTSGTQLQQTIAQQVSSTKQVSLSANSISKRSQELAKTVVQLSEKTQNTTSFATQSKNNLLQVQQSMHDLVVVTETVQNKFSLLGDTTKGIESIIETITKVADQTNLLSLNAAIEAEKAKEFGVGFAVVAREIRRLADQTAMATLDIEKMIQEMQISLFKGIEEVGSFVKKVRQAASSTEQLSQQMGLIIADVESLAPQFQKASSDVQRQTTDAEGISFAIEQVTQAAQQLEKMLNDTNSISQKLHQSALIMYKQSSQFKVD